MSKKCKKTQCKEYKNYLEHQIDDLQLTIGFQDARNADVERTLRASVARNAIVARENRELWTAYEAVRVERDEWQRMADEVAENNEELQSDLGESQAGREAEKTMLVKQRMQWQETAAKRRILLDGCYEKIESLESNLETAHRWKTYADSIESQIEILQTAIDERDERLDNIKFFLSDGGEG